VQKTLVDREGVGEFEVTSVEPGRRSMQVMSENPTDVGSSEASVDTDNGRHRGRFLSHTRCALVFGRVKSGNVDRRMSAFVGLDWPIFVCGC